VITQQKETTNVVGVWNNTLKRYFEIEKKRERRLEKSA
jgi:hypothetical protein